jgi:hypothetical protein
VPKSLVIYGLFALAAACSLPVQIASLEWLGQGTAQPASGTDNRKQPSVQGAPKIGPLSPEPASLSCDESCQQTRQNIAIQRNLERFTGGLVLVGFLQVCTMFWQGWVLRRTLQKIKEQADFIRRQNQMTEDLQRARISVEVPPNELTVEDGPEWTEGVGRIYIGSHVSVVNHGSTKAFNLLAYGTIVATSSTVPPPVTKDELLQAPNVWAPDAGETNIDVINLVELGTQDAITQGTKFVHLFGVVTYEDIFGNKRETSFRYVWREEGMDVEGQWFDSSHWVKSSADNRAT